MIPLSLRCYHTLSKHIPVATVHIFAKYTAEKKIAKMIPRKLENKYFCLNNAKCFDSFYSCYYSLLGVLVRIRNRESFSWI
jgi:aspartate carbamoyltransferase regulatory subunit